MGGPTCHIHLALLVGARAAPNPAQGKRERKDGSGEDGRARGGPRTALYQQSHLVPKKLTICEAGHTEVFPSFELFWIRNLEYI